MGVAVGRGLQVREQGAGPGLPTSELGLDRGGPQFKHLDGTGSPEEGVTSELVRFTSHEACNWRLHLEALLAYPGWGEDSGLARRVQRSSSGHTLLDGQDGWR